MKLKDFLRGLVLDYNSTIKFKWIDKNNETVYSEVEYNSNRWSIYDTDDMFDDLVSIWGDYIVNNWHVDEERIIIDMIKPNEDDCLSES